MTLSRRAVGVGLVVMACAAAGGLALYWTKAEVPPEERIVRAAVTMAREAERRDVGAVMAPVSERFRSAEGWSRDELRGVVLGHLMRGQWVRAFPVDLKAELVGPDAAEFSGTFVFGRSPTATLADLARSSEMSAYRIEARFEREADGEWRAVSASHQPLNPGDLL
ncbi:MAG TPA: hypothetical protein VEY30_07255 [Myxococcaceae bacterium]|nr:hypothetical protein [Myxococcaceae bacterium]